MTPLRRLAWLIGCRLVEWADGDDVSLHGERLQERARWQLHQRHTDLVIHRRGHLIEVTGCNRVVRFKP